MKGLYYLFIFISLQVSQIVTEELVACPATGQVFLASPSSCSEFIECNNGEYRVVSCIDGLYFDSTLGWCDFPEDVDCIIEDFVEIVDDKVDGSGSGDLDEEIGDSDEYGSGENGSGDNDEDDLIGGDGSEGDNGEIGSGDTDDSSENNDVNDDGYESEEENGDLDQEDADDNEDGSSENESGDNDDSGDNNDGDDDSNESDDGQQGNDDNEDSNENEVEEDNDDNNGDNICPATGQHFYPHPYYCSQFIECKDGVYQVIECIAGLHFDPDLGWCDFPENIGCTDSTPAPTTTEEPAAEPGPVGECPEENQEHVTFLTHSADCTLYYMCNWGTPILMTCPGDLHFNPTLNVCDYQEAAGCTASQ